MTERHEPRRRCGAAQILVPKLLLAIKLLRLSGLALLAACAMALSWTDAARAGSTPSTTGLTSSVNPSVAGEPVTFTATVVGSGGVFPTGSVNFIDDAGTVGTATLAPGVGSTATATFTTSALPAGDHPFSASYGGDPTYAGSTGTLVGNPQVVNKADTTTSVSSSPNPSGFGQGVTFTAVVSPLIPGAGTPMGTVTFLDGGNPLGTTVLSGGIATFTTSTLTGGNHSITATYNADANFKGSTGSLTGNQVVNKAATAVSITSAVPNPSNSGQAVTFTATVTSTSGIPTGTVSFQDGANPLGNVTLTASGVAAFTTSSLGPGGHTITAVYNGDSNFTGTTSAPITQTVSASGSKTALSSSPNPSGPGQAVTFTAAVTSSSGIPTGTVIFLDGANPVGSGPLNASGVAAFTTSSLGLGAHTITAVHNGDSSFTGSTSAPITQAVNSSGTKTALSSNSNPSGPGQVVTFTASVTPAAGTGTPTGSVTFNDGATTLGSSALVAGTATFATSSLALGTHSITAVYGGDSTFSTSTSPVLAQSVNVPADSIKLRALQLQVTKMEAQGSGAAASGAIDEAIADGFSENGPLISGNDNGVHFNFTDDPPEQQRKQTFEDRAGFAFTAPGYAGPPPEVKAPPPRIPRDWFFWADVRGTGWNTGLQTGDIRGSQTNGFVGFTRKITPYFLVGVFGGGETFDFTSQVLSGRLKGNGWTAGGYLGARLLPGLRFEFGGAYSGVSYDGVSGTASGSFPGRRWLLTSGLVGVTRTSPGFEIENSARVYALWEREDAYTDSLGTSQDARTFSTGRASAGSKVSYPMMWPGSTLTVIPYAGAYADYYFNTDNGTLPAAAAVPVLLPTQSIQGWSARVTTGVGVRTQGGAQFTVGGELGGLGSDHFTTWTVRGRASLPF